MYSVTLFICDAELERTRRKIRYAQENAAYALLATWPSAQVIIDHVIKSNFKKFKMTLFALFVGQAPLWSGTFI